MPLPHDSTPPRFGQRDGPPPSCICHLLKSCRAEQTIVVAGAGRPTNGPA
jgi:hypothetical protein